MATEGASGLGIDAKMLEEMVRMMMSRTNPRRHIDELLAAMSILGGTSRKASDVFSEIPDISSHESSRRLEFLTGFISESTLRDELQGLFLTKEKGRAALHFQVDVVSSAYSYSRLFRALNDIYTLFVSLQIPEYFVDRWLKEELGDLRPEDELKVLSITKNSPDEIKLQGISAGLKALGEAVSIGDQYQKIRVTEQKIREAKAAARAAELLVEESERAARLASLLEAETASLELERRRAELRMIKLRLEEDELRLSRQKRADADEGLTLLQKHAPIIERLPEPLQKKIVASLLSGITEIDDLPFSRPEVRHIKAGVNSADEPGEA